MPFPFNTGDTMKLQQVLSHLENKYKKLPKFNICEDQFCSCDAESLSYVLEYKSRGADYPDIMIEGLKLQKNLRKAQQTNREFIYVSEFNGIIRSWNISKLVSSGVTFKWELKWLPVETEITENDEHMWKVVAYLPVELAAEH